MAIDKIFTAFHHLKCISLDKGTLSFSYPPENYPPASWSRGNAFVSGAGGVRFKSRTDQIGHSFDNGSPPLQRFFQRSCAARRNDAEMGPANSLHATA